MTFLKKIFLFISGALLSFSLFNFAKPSLASASSDTININNVQIRGDQNAEYYKFLVLIADNFNGKTTKQINNIASYNTASKISLYTSEDSEPVLLSSITDNFSQQNIWTQPGLFINISESNYEKYNGSTVYRIVIESGCEVPVDGVTYVTNKTYSFKNNNYNEASAKYSGFSWASEKVYTKVNTTINNVQLRGEEGNAYFGIEDSHYASISTSTVCDEITKFNLLDKVKFYMSEDDIEGILLKDLTSATQWQENMWASSAIMVKIDNDKYDIYNGSTVYAIEILDDCHIPCGELELIIEKGSYYKNNHLNDSEYKFSNFYWELSKHYIKEALNTTGIQLRGDADSEDQYYFVIRDERYLSFSQGSIFTDVTSFNVLDKVKFYLNKEDEEGTFLRSLVKNDSPWIINQWESSGIMFKMDKSTYESFNGTNVYAIELLEGLNIPCGDYKLSLDNPIKFYNLHYEDKSYKYEAFDWSLTEPYTPINYDIELTSVQLRADLNAKEYYFVLQADNYIDEIPGDYIGNKNKFNVLDNVTLYTSKEDEIGSTLSSLTDQNKPWRINLWESHGLMIPLTEEAYQTFNGSSTYGVKINENTIMPLSNDMVTVVEEVYFVNTVYQNEDYFASGFYFVKAIKNIMDFGNVNITRIQNRANDAARWLMVSVNEPFEQYMIVTALVENLNTLDKIKIYYSPEDKVGTPLREINENIFENYLFGENTTLGIRISTNSKNIGPNMYKIIFENGCQIPYYLNGEYGYKTVSTEFVFVNDDYQKTGDIFNVYDENNLPRTYEQWSVNWSNRLIINFTVVGMDDLIIPSIEVGMGEYLDLTIYYVEGYSLTITTAYGSTIYQGFTPEESGVTLIMTYKKVNNEQKDEPSRGCNGSIDGGVILFMSTLILIPFINILKRKEDR